MRRLPVAIMLVALVTLWASGAIPQPAPSKLPSAELWVEPPNPRPAMVAPAAGVWPFASWSYAKAYTFNFFPATSKVQLRILNGGTWSSHVRAERLADRDQALQVVQLVNATKGSFVTSKCPFPRHAFVFFDGTDKPVASVDVCFECDDLFASPDFKIGSEAKYGTFDDSEAAGRKGGLWKEFEAALPAYKSLLQNLGLPIAWQQTP